MFSEAKIAIIAVKDFFSIITSVFKNNYTSVSENDQDAAILHSANNFRENSKAMTATEIETTSDLLEVPWGPRRGHSVVEIIGYLRLLLTHSLSMSFKLN